MGTITLFSSSNRRSRPLDNLSSDFNALATACGFVLPHLIGTEISVDPMICSLIMTSCGSMSSSCRHEISVVIPLGKALGILVHRGYFLCHGFPNIIHMMRRSLNTSWANARLHFSRSPSAAESPPKVLWPSPF